MKLIEDICKEAEERYPKKLYRYLEPKVNRISEVLLEDKLYFSSASDFNDPFDCRPVIKNEGMHYKKEKYCKKLVKDRNPEWDKLKVKKEAKKLSRNLPPKSFYYAKFEEVVNKIGILCLSERNDNILMWGHYCFKHKGVCLEFTTSRDDKMFLQAYPVYYEDKLPVYDVFHKNRDDSILEILITKSVDWEYENEWRIWLEKEGPGIHFFNPKRLTGLIFGCRAEREFIETIMSIVGERKEPIKMYQALEKEKQFGLGIIPL